MRPDDCLCLWNSPRCAVDLTENPVNPAGIGGDTATGVACLTNSAGGAGYDSRPRDLPVSNNSGRRKPAYSARRHRSHYDQQFDRYNTDLRHHDRGQLHLTVAHPPVTILGFLQVFINQVNARRQPERDSDERLGLQQRCRRKPDRGRNFSRTGSSDYAAVNWNCRTV